MYITTSEGISSPFLIPRVTNFSNLASVEAVTLECNMAISASDQSLCSGAQMNSRDVRFGKIDGE